MSTDAQPTPPTPPTPPQPSGPAVPPAPPAPPRWYTPYLPWLIRLALVAVTALATRYGIPPAVLEVIKEVPVVVQAPANDPAGPAPPDARFANGWVRDDDAVKAVADSLPHPVFAATPAGQVETIPDRVHLWDYAKVAISKHVPTRDQGSVGSCVSFGAACAVEYQECVIRVVALKAGQPPPDFKDVSQEVIYGGSRVQIGGGRIRGDGSGVRGRRSGVRSTGAFRVGSTTGTT
jgi:hypothetical protein